MVYIGKYISEHQLVELANLPNDNNIEYNITYQNLQDATGGFLEKNGLVQVKEGMIFQITIND